MAEKKLKKLKVVYGWREERKPAVWFHHLHRVDWQLRPREDFRTHIANWMTRQECEIANRKLARAGLQWVDAGEKPRRA